MNRLLDSNILIYAAQPEHAFLDAWMSAATARVSAISIPEVLGYSGLTAGDEAIFEEWFSALIVHAVVKSNKRKIIGNAHPQAQGRTHHGHRFSGRRGWIGR